MAIYSDLIKKKEKISVIGLGYVGLPIAVAFSKKVDVIGFDVDNNKIDSYKKGIDPTDELGNDIIKKSSIYFTNDELELKKSKFHIVAVPTPINKNYTPDLSPIKSASKIVGRNLTKGSIVVFESTVYPGVTEDICIPILEKESSLKCGIDFKVGYSPERINPGDKEHRFENICKIVSGMDNDSLQEIKKVYDLVVEIGTYPVSSIKTAEAIKVAENSQRDINIAFINELAMIFDNMGIDTNEVIDGMNTKWNSLGFRPGLVGGHCIGVDPYYILYKAKKIKYKSRIILNGRIVNNEIGKYVGDVIIRYLSINQKKYKKKKVAILGFTFKENCSDIRNSKVYDIVKKLRKNNVTTFVYDPLADKEKVKKEYNIDLKDLEDIKNVDCVVLAVAHDKIKKLTLKQIDLLFNSKLSNNKRILIDVKSMKSKKDVEKLGYTYWRL